MKGTTCRKHCYRRRDAGDDEVSTRKRWMERYDRHVYGRLPMSMIAGLVVIVLLM